MWLLCSTRRTDEEAGEADEAVISPAKWKILWQSFTLTFLAEWGDRSQVCRSSCGPIPGQVSPYLTRAHTHRLQPLLWHPPRIQLEVRQPHPCICCCCCCGSLVIVLPSTSCCGSDHWRCPGSRHVHRLGCHWWPLVGNQDQRAHSRHCRWPALYCVCYPLGVRWP